MEQVDFSQSFFAQDTPLLIIQPLVGIGDMIWHKPWIDDAIMRTEVFLATKPASHPQVLFSDSLDSAHIIDIDRNIRGKRGRHDGLFGLFRLARDFRATGAKRALLLHHSNTYHTALKLAGIKQVAGFGFGKMKGLVGHTLTPQDNKLHATDRMAKFWQANDWPEPEYGWQIGVSEERREACQTSLLAQNINPNNLMIFGIGAMHEDRCWPASRFANLISQLRLERPDLALAIMGGPAERQIAQNIQAELSSSGAPAIHEIFGSLEDAIATISLAKGYVGNDTSLLNIAAVLGIPSLGLFSQSPPLTYVPTMHHLDVIKDEDYGKAGIILQYEVDDVLAGIEAIWAPPT